MKEYDQEIMIVVSRTMMMSLSKKKVLWLDRKRQERKKGETNLIIFLHVSEYTVYVETACNPGESNDIDRMTLRTSQFAIVKEQCEWTLGIIFLAQLEDYFTPLNVTSQAWSFHFSRLILQIILQLKNLI